MIDHPTRAALRETSACQSKICHSTLRTAFRRSATALLGASVAAISAQAQFGAPLPGTTEPVPEVEIVTIDIDAGPMLEMESFESQDTTLDAGALSSLDAKTGSLVSAIARAAGKPVPSGLTRGGGLGGGLGGSLNGALTLALDSEGESDDGLTHLRLHQKVDGVRVYGSEVKATYKGGSLDHFVARTVPTLFRTLDGNVPEAEAIATAVALHHGPAANAEGYWHEAPSAEPVMIAKGYTMERGWEVSTWSDADNRLHLTVVDASGDVVEVQNRTSQDRYRIYREDPNSGSNYIKTGPRPGGSRSPDGWLNTALTQYTRLIQGNNVAAYMDRSNSNTPDGGVAEVVSNGDFLTRHLKGSEPSVYNNQNASVQNLFYLNNRIHDDLWGHGFREGTGNFQTKNFGRGGRGNDNVYAEAQDGSGTNNANFATPADGSHPRMQMYVWTKTRPSRDSGLDSDVVWHEYGHGLTWRMIGNMSGPVAGAIGEGMGDVLAIIHNNDDAVGEYSQGNSRGIRSERYGNYSRTMGDFTGRSVHFDGEIYAAAMWRLGQNYKAAGVSTERMLSDAIRGMNYTPSRPTYIQMRDGVLRGTPSSRDCLVWRAFADYGMGQGAVFTVSGSRISVGESFSVPSNCR